MLGDILPRMSFAEIREEVLKLSEKAKAELRALLHDPADDEWDKQMKADAAAGRLDALLAEVDADVAAGRVREMP